MKTCSVGLTLVSLLACAASEVVAMSVRSSEITPAQVASAINAAGVEVAPRQVFLLSDVISNTSAPILQVESIQPWGTDELRVRLHCSEPSECLPFFVMVGGHPNRPEILPARMSDGIAKVREHNAHEPGVIVMHAGALAVLLLDGTHIHIRLSVSCLEGGELGKTIRVADKEHHTYLAQICSDGLLRGKL